MIINFKYIHPEIKDGEAFLMNATISDYDNIRWTTKRKGTIAYDINNKIIKKMFPVFVKKQELINGGIKVE